MEKPYVGITGVTTEQEVRDNEDNLDLGKVRHYLQNL